MLGAAVAQPTHDRKGCGRGFEMLPNLANMNEGSRATTLDNFSPDLEVGIISIDDHNLPVASGFSGCAPTSHRSSSTRRTCKRPNMQGRASYHQMRFPGCKSLNSFASLHSNVDESLFSIQTTNTLITSVVYPTADGLHVKRKRRDLEKTESARVG